MPQIIPVANRHPKSGCGQPSEQAGISSGFGFQTNQGGPYHLEIYTVDMQKIFEAHPAAREAVEKLQAEQRKMQLRVNNTDQEDLQSARQELQQQRNRFLSEAMSQVRDDVERIAEEAGYEYVVDESVLLVGGRDVTEEVMGRIDGSV